MAVSMADHESQQQSCSRCRGPSGPLSVLSRFFLIGLYPSVPTRWKTRACRTAEAAATLGRVRRTGPAATVSTPHHSCDLFDHQGRSAGPRRSWGMISQRG